MNGSKWKQTAANSEVNFSYINFNRFTIPPKNTTLPSVICADYSAKMNHIYNSTDVEKKKKILNRQIYIYQMYVCYILLPTTHIYILFTIHACVPRAPSHLLKTEYYIITKANRANKPTTTTKQMNKNLRSYLRSVEWTGYLLKI